MTATHATRSDNEAPLRLRLPGDIRFAPVVETAVRIFTLALPGGDELYPRLETGLAEAVASLLDGDDDPVEIELRFEAPELSVTLCGRGGDLEAAALDAGTGRLQVQSLDGGHGVRLSWPLDDA